MPNNRNRNRNRRNKNRKNNNQQQRNTTTEESTSNGPTTQEQTQNDQLHAEKEICGPWKTVALEETTITRTTTAETAEKQKVVAAGDQTKQVAEEAGIKPVVATSSGDGEVCNSGDDTASAAVDTLVSGSGAALGEPAAQSEEDEEAGATPTSQAQEQQRETVSPETVAAKDMGNKQSRAQRPLVAYEATATASASASANGSANASGSENQVVASYGDVNTVQVTQQAKVIVHRVVPEFESPRAQESVQQLERLYDTQNTQPHSEHLQKNAKVIIHHITVDRSFSADDTNVEPESPRYHVESPKNSADESFSDEAAFVKKSQNNIRSKIQIQEISDASSDTGEYTDDPPLVSEVESEPDTPLSGDSESNRVARELQLVEPISPNESQQQQQQHDQQEERLRKRLALEHHFLPQVLNPRYLHSITEENSDMSDTRSEPSDNSSNRAVKREDTHSEGVARAIKANVPFPKSNLDFTRPHRHGPLSNTAHTHRHGMICEEPLTIVVETKVIEHLSSLQTPESEAAEVIYIDSASSSSSEQNDNEPEEHISNISRPYVNLDTDVSEIITKPPVVNTIVKSMPLPSQTDTADVLADAEREFAVLFPDEGKQSDVDSSVSSVDATNAAQTIDLLANSFTNYHTKDTDRVEASSAINPATATVTAATVTTIHSIPVSKERSLSPTSVDDYLSAAQAGQGAYECAAALTPTPTASACMTRQESGDSYCSDSTSFSQCTAVNLTDSDVKSLLSDKQSFSLPTATDEDACGCEERDPDVKKLRLLCAEKVSSLPYGDDVLEELANVAQNIADIQAASHSTQVNSIKDNMPYPLPDLPLISDLQVFLASKSEISQAPQTITITQLHSEERNSHLAPPPRPPSPLQASVASDAAWVGLPTDSNPQMLVCFSPSQQSYIQTNKVFAESNPEQLLEAHNKFVERRGYHEYSRNEVDAINREKMAEQNILKTAEIMRKLRKSLTPPPVPPVPAMSAVSAAPPPVPRKSSETAAKAQNKQKLAHTYDAAFRGGTEQAVASYADEDENRHRLLAIIQDTSSSSTSDESEQRSVAPALVPEAESPSSLENNSRQATIKAGAALAPLPPSTQPTTQAASPQNQPRQSPPPPLLPPPPQSPPVPPPPPQASSVSIPLRPLSQATTTEKTTTATTIESSLKSISNSAVGGPATVQIVGASPASAHHSGQLPSQVDSKAMAATEAGKMYPPWPSMSSATRNNIFNLQPKRFSSVEFPTAMEFQTPSTGGYCSQILSTQPKRYSSIETSSFESQKRTENGQVVHDVSKSSHEHHSDGKKLPLDELRAPFTHATFSSDIGSGTPAAPVFPAAGDAGSAFGVRDTPLQAKGIMSPLKLNWPNATTKTTTNTSTSESTRENKEIFTNRRQSENFTFSKDTKSNYEEFRQRAKAAAEQAFATGQKTADSTQQTSDSQQQTKHTAQHFDHGKLLEGFDELSRQLHQELEAGKRRHEQQRNRCTSMYDLNTQVQFSDRFEELKRQRHEHMQELEREIERSSKSRQLLFAKEKDSKQRIYDIPIKLEDNARVSREAVHQGKADLGAHHSRTVHIPIQLEPRPRSKGAEVLSPQHFEHGNDSRFRRAESMFNLSQKQFNDQPRPRTASSYYPDQQSGDDWARYASDLGSSENITRPFAREVEICYQGNNGRNIRAPRMSVSTSDVSSCTNAQNQQQPQHHYHIASQTIPVRRTHAPMLSQAPLRNKPRYHSCYSMIERNPYPTYIGTTTRKGVSLAGPLEPNVDERRMRRASLPRELHEQQLKYISSKEEELRTEFGRLQIERRRLMEELQNPPPAVPQVPMRESYRQQPAPKLPTLSEGEVFRQQMAEEWLNKVAEREERRLQRIIKISKVNEDGPPEVSARTSSLKSDLGEEFLTRVKERRSKLAMPADSDWESGAESHPVAPGQQSDAEDVPIKIMEGALEADLRQLPRHLREFAKFSNRETDTANDLQREVQNQEEHERTSGDNFHSTFSKKSSVVKTVQKGPAGMSVKTEHQINNHGIPSGATTTIPEHPPRAKAQPTWSHAADPAAKLPASLGESFAASPFKSLIFEEFDNYWRRFNSQL